VVHIRKISIDDAVNLISHTASLPKFQTTPESEQALDNLVLAARVKCMIFDAYPNVDVTADDGTVVVHTEGPLEQEEAIRKRIRALITGMPGVEDARVHVRPTSFVYSVV